LITVYPNDFQPSYQDGFVFSDIMTDSIGQYYVHYDTLPASVERVVIRVDPPGCYWGGQVTTVDDPSLPSSGPHAITQDVVLLEVASRATSAVGQLCAKISDQGVFGYSGSLFVIVDQSNLAGTAGGLALEGRWTINWSPTYGSSDGTFLGAQVDSRVALEFRDTTGTVECPPVRWEGTVDSAGSWGTLTPTIEGGGYCQWANFPVMFTEDTTSWPWF